TPWFPNTIPGAWGRLSPLVPGVALPCGAQIRAGPPRRPALSHALQRAPPSTSTPGDALCPPDASQNCSRDIRRVTCAAWGKFTKTSQQINTETNNITLVRFDPCTCRFRPTNHEEIQGHLSDWLAMTCSCLK